LTPAVAGPIFAATGADVRRALLVEKLAMAEFPAPQSASSTSAGPVSAGLLAYVLFGIAAVMGFAAHGLPFFVPLVGVLGIVALIVCYVKRADAAGTWVASHFTWLIGMFWWSLVWTIVGFVILFTLGLILIGIPIAIGIFLAVDIWVIYRLVRGYLLFKDSRAIPGVA
jgi:uncharacterized membrane protein